MKKIRQTFLEMQKGLLDINEETWTLALCFTNIIVIGIIYLAVCFTSMIFMAFDLNIVSYTIIAIAMLMLIIFFFNDKLFCKFVPLSFKLNVYFFGRYGKVVTKKDWKKIKKNCHKFYRDMWWSKKYAGHCYWYSWFIALFLKDAELMYCSIVKENGERTGHSVIVKNNCVFDTNQRQHYELETYKKNVEVIVYKMFSEKEYKKGTFFEDIKEDFMKWCKENNSYCGPQ